YGWLLCFGIFISTCCQTMSLHHAYWFGTKLSIEVRGSLIGTMYRKMLRLNHTSRTKYTGKIINLITMDAGNVGEYFWTSYCDVLIHPLHIILLLLLLCYIIGPSGLVGFATLGIFLPLTTFFNTRKNRYFTQTMGHSDKRIKIISEFICGIRFLKLYNWERYFFDRCDVERNKQLDSSRTQLMYYVIDQTFASMSNLVVLLATFGTYIGVGNTLTAQTAFPALTILYGLRTPLYMWTFVLQKMLQMMASTKRIEEFLQAPEVAATSSPSDSSDGVSIKDSEFTWNDQSINDFQDKDSSSLLSMESSHSHSNSVLKGINFEPPKGKLTVIVGRVGEGKSSLVSAILGEIKMVAGSVARPESVGYTPQVPWILSGTVRDNILFGRPLDWKRYKDVLEACCLKVDLVDFPMKDLSEIGEKGISLSGGQKQRISLARCLYANTDVIVMDEPLSAVDAEVGKHLFEECIQGMMSGRTRILVTHQIQFISSADHIVVIEQGRLIQGTYDQLQSKGIDFEEIMNTKFGGGVGLGVEPSHPPATSDPLTNSVDQVKHIDINDCVVIDQSIIHDPVNELRAKLITVEERNKGEIGKSTYIPYFKSGGPTILYIFVFLAYLCAQLASQSADYWLLIWTSNNGESKHYLMIYGLIIAIFGILVCVKMTSISYMTWNASKKLHHTMMHSVFNSPTTFFDSNPSGRILNRFSKDIGDLDYALLESINDVVSCGTSFLIALALMAYLTPYILIPVCLLSLYYYQIQKFYRHSSRELKRMDSISRSPIFGHVSESFNGLSSIRVFGQQQRFVDTFDQHVDLNLRIFYHAYSVNRWLGMNLELMTGLMVLSASIIAMLTASYSPSVAGIVVTSAIGITGMLNIAIRQYSELEVRMNSVERILEYVQLPREGARVVADNRPDEGWPNRGEIEFKNIEVRYRPNLEPSLRDINLSIGAGNKIGIVGRTGAGKSTIGLTLFRLVEPCKGAIYIDGVDITKIGLDDLRGKLCVIPQDPFIFSGTVRMNIDPFNEHTDLDLWQALEKVNMKHVVESMPMKLDGTLEEGGDGFSVGQKQLLCLVRALLNKSPVILMDEATASLDYATDALIKRVIETNFKDRTVLTIAHRLDTIIDSDLIVVVDRGQVVEYDSPNNLLNLQPDSRFKQLVNAQSNVLSLRHGNGIGNSSPD
ncbi:hypothetical protein SAMD00019534_042350, partial [Acytostelium subglobosum LB1]|uniref:hypothetical protein n=1 Tax=Acytostelium subglobosum LB1 TaxID=1410327 RepID=UPI0006449074